jgi:hypothetical protein
MDDVYAHTPTRLSVLRYLQRLMVTVTCGGWLRKDWWTWSSSESRGAGVNTVPRALHRVSMSPVRSSTKAIVWLTVWCV